MAKKGTASPKKGNNGLKGGSKPTSNNMPKPKSTKTKKGSC